MSKNTGTLVHAAIRPNDSLDDIASAFSNEIKGGYHSYATTNERDGIMSSRRQWGMLAYCVDTDKRYKLTEGYVDAVITNNANWKEEESGGAAAGLPEDTYAGWDAKRLTGELPAGKVLITDRDIILNTLSPVLFDTVGTYISRCPVYQPIENMLGQWHAGMTNEGVAINDIVAYNGYHYVNLTGDVGTDPAYDTVNWSVLGVIGGINELLDRSTRTHASYVIEYYQVGYIFSIDRLTRVYDPVRKNNIELSNMSFNHTEFFKFQWGNDAVKENVAIDGRHSNVNQTGYYYGNSVKHGGSIYAEFSAGSVWKNKVEGDSNLYANNIPQSSQVHNNYIHTISSLTATGYQGNCHENEVGESSVFDITAYSGEVWNNKVIIRSEFTSVNGSGSLLGNIVEQQSFIRANSCTANIYKNTCAQSSKIYLGSSSGYIYDSLFRSDSTLYAENSTGQKQYLTAESNSEINISNSTGSFFYISVCDEGYFDSNGSASDATKCSAQSGSLNASRNNSTFTKVRVINSTVNASDNVGTFSSVLFTNIPQSVTITNNAKTLYNKECRNGYSNFEDVLNITDQSSVTIPSNMKHCGVIYLSSTNIAETIYSVEGAMIDDQKYVFKPEGSLLVTFIKDSSLILDGGVDAVINATKLEWIELTNSRYISSSNSKKVFEINRGRY